MLKEILIYIYSYSTYIAYISVFVCFLWFIFLRFGARVFAREHQYVLQGDMPLIGKPDLVMQEWGGLLVCHDLKTRKKNRVYDSDVLQLSLYAFILRHATKRKVASYAYIRIKTDQGFFLKKVELTWSDHDIVNLYNRFNLCKMNPEMAHMTAKSYFCKSCGFYGSECQGKTLSG